MAFGLASVVLGLGFTFHSGAVEAWLVDALKATGYEGELDHVSARGVPVFAALRRMDEPADHFAGSDDGCRGPAADQGLPDVATVDSVPRQPESVTG